MGKLLVLIAAAAFMLGLNGHAEDAVTTAEKTTLANDTNAFALDLYKTLKSGEKGNLFLSPYSISTALAMTYAGARGTTAKQMEQALHFSLGQARLHPVASALFVNLNAANQNGKKRGFQLNVANRLFIQKDYTLRADFVATTDRAYGAGVEELDFAGNTEASRLHINKYVEQKTNERIKDLIPLNGVNAVTKLVLTNAIYFKGDWALQFKKDATANAPFHAANGDVDAPLMNQTEYFGYFENETTQGVELPYTGDELSMVVLLPKKADGLAELEDALTPASLKTMLSSLVSQQVAVALPKFKMKWGTVDVAGAMQKLGMVDACSPAAADFSGITDHPNGLYIAAIFHQAFVDVNEEGTEAAAATAVVMAPRGRPPRPKVFRADRPFLFLIREKATGTILFMGRVLDPR